MRTTIVAQATATTFPDPYYKDLPQYCMKCGRKLTCYAAIYAYDDTTGKPKIHHTLSCLKKPIWNTHDRRHFYNGYEPQDY